jgi:antitoxin HicB
VIPRLNNAKEGKMLNYPVEMEDDDGTVMVSFPDVPGARTFGADRADALANAVDALETMLSAIISDREDIPAPSAARGRPTVAPTLLGSLKVAVYQAMRARSWRKADLARALSQNPRQIDRLLDLRHASTVGQLEAALAACGQRAQVETRELEAA